jgi:hypothetical protein
MAPRALKVAVAAIALSSGLASASSLRTKSSTRRNRGGPLKDTLPWIRSSVELHEQLKELADNCWGADVEMSTSSKMNNAEASGTEVDLDVLRIKGKNASPNSKALFVFGEHARELITGEAALGLVKKLCGKAGDSDEAQRALKGTEYVIVPNANPVGRKMVEDGYYCKRTNEDHVDLNRNWSDDHRDTSIEKGDEMWPGTGGFSEPETQLLKDLIDSENPDVYLSVHSGAYLLGMPYGYERSRIPEDETAMMEALKPISDKHCPDGCPYGNLAELINYDNPGCDIDYVYEKIKSPYVFTWEIYVGEGFRDRYNGEAQMRQAEMDKKAKGQSFLQRRSSLAEEATGPEDNEDIESCLDQFNPPTEEETAQVVDNWSGAFLDLSLEVSAKKNATQAAAGASAMATAGPSLMDSSSDLASYVPASTASTDLASTDTAAPSEVKSDAAHDTANTKSLLGETSSLSTVANMKSLFDDDKPLISWLQK